LVDGAVVRRASRRRFDSVVARTRTPRRRGAEPRGCGPAPCRILATPCACPRPARYVRTAVTPLSILQAPRMRRQAMVFARARIHRALISVLVASVLVAGGATAAAAETPEGEPPPAEQIAARGGTA